MTRVADAGRHAELDEAFGHVADDAQPGAEPVRLDGLDPDAPDGAADGLVPDPAAFVDVGLLLTTRPVRIERIGARGP